MMNNFLNSLNELIVFHNENIGGYLLLVLLVPVGVYFTFKFKLNLA